LALAAQLAFALIRPDTRATIQPLPEAPDAGSLRLLAQGEPMTAAQWLTLRLQAFDDQPGTHLPLAALDTSRLIRWLDALLELDPASQYPLLLATRVYTQGADPARARALLEVAHRAFLRDPERRWPWLAHAVVAARHGLRDMPLALAYARDLSRHATHAPGWARQMEIFLLEDIGEIETARVLLGGLIDSGQVQDPHERAFLLGRLDAMEKSPRTRPR
jgi:hypothetical protein